MLGEIGGLRLHVESVAAKFKYGDQNPARIEKRSPPGSISVTVPTTPARPPSSAGGCGASESGPTRPGARVDCSPRDLDRPLILSMMNGGSDQTMIRAAIAAM